VNGARGIAGDGPGGGLARPTRLAHTGAVLAPLRAAFVTACLAAPFGCTVDSEEGMTSLGGTTVPGGTTVSTTVGTTESTGTASSGTGDTASEETSAGSTAESGSESSASGESGTATTGGTGDTGEQPADGPYSECATVVDCFGATTCAVVMPGVGFCTNACVTAAECAAAPGGSTTLACVPNGAPDMLVCALDCVGGGGCPGGMVCQPFGATMVCV